MGRATAEAYGDDVWDSQSTEMMILDCRVVSLGRSYGLRVSYDWMGDSGVRTLKTTEAVEQFLYESPHSYMETSPEIDSWDADMGL